MTLYNDRRKNGISNAPDPKIAALMRDQALTGGMMYPDASYIINSQQFGDDNYGVSPNVPEAGASAGGGMMY